MQALLCSRWCQSLPCSQDKKLTSHSLNAGTPLLEIVSEPDMRSGQEAAAYASELRRIMRFIGTSDGNMQVPFASSHLHLS